MSTMLNSISHPHKSTPSDLTVKIKTITMKKCSQGSLSEWERLESNRVDIFSQLELVDILIEFSGQFDIDQTLRYYETYNIRRDYNH